MYLSQYYVVSSWTHGQHPQQTAAYQFERSAWKFQPAVCSSAPLNLVWNMNTTQNVIEFNHAAAHRRQRCLHGTTALSSAQKKITFCLPHKSKHATKTKWTRSTRRQQTSAADPAKLSQFALSRSGKNYVEIPVSGSWPGSAQTANSLFLVSSETSHSLLKQFIKIRWQLFELSCGLTDRQTARQRQKQNILGGCKNKNNVYEKQRKKSSYNACNINRHAKVAGTVAKRIV